MAQVLLLDDDEDLLQSLAELLQVMSYGCLLAHNFRELTDLGEAGLACDVAVLDINLGKDQPSGIDAFHWLRENKFAGRIVFLTGHGQSHPLVVAAQRLGASRILSKPFVLDELRSVLRL